MATPYEFADSGDASVCAQHQGESVGSEILGSGGDPYGSVIRAELARVQESTASFLPGLCIDDFGGQRTISENADFSPTQRTIEENPRSSNANSFVDGGMDGGRDIDAAGNIPAGRDVDAGTVQPPRHNDGGASPGGIPAEHASGGLDAGTTGGGDRAPAPREAPACHPGQAGDRNMRSEDLSRWTNTHFDELDSNRDGFINNGEIETAMQNPCYSGTDAQALVALHRRRGEIQELSNDEWGFENDGITRNDATELGRQATGLRNELNQDAAAANYGTAHFATLDADHNGYINDTEINRALNDTALPVQDRAALEHMRDQYQQIEGAHNDELGRENSGISRGDLQDHWDRDSHRTINQIDNDLIESAETINHSNPNLYGNSDNPLESIRPEAVRQGAVGDCQMLAPLAGLARSNPRAIQDMIHDNHNGTYTVTFPGDRQHPVTVDAPTQAELAEYARGNEHGTWAAVIEKAAGARRTTGDGSPQHGARMTESQAYELLTGRRAARHDVSDVSDQELQRRMANCHNEPISAITNYEIDGADQRHDQTNIPMGHEYTITNYDARTQTVTLRNPWGNGEPTDSNGNARDGQDDGQFTMSYDEFRRTFDRVEYAN